MTGASLDVSHAAGMVAGIDDDGSVANPIGLDELRFADGADEDLGAAHDVGQVFRARMADGDGGIRAEEHHGHGLAEDGAAAYDYRFLPGRVDAVALEQPHNAGGRG